MVAEISQRVCLAEELERRGWWFDGPDGGWMHNRNDDGMLLPFGTLEEACAYLGITSRDHPSFETDESEEVTEPSSLKTSKKAIPEQHKTRHMQRNNPFR